MIRFVKDFIGSEGLKLRHVAESFHYHIISD